tara:strand:+ start:372 stop:1217 length:846 start_codon:yes stop_codon:yes gene_type:complete
MVLRGTLTKPNNPEIKNLLFGGIAGSISRTIVAPIDKIKILMQFNNTKLSFYRFLRTNIKEEGFINLWKGNGVNLLRIFPFSGLQFCTYDLCKKKFLDNKRANNYQRILFGSIAGIVATSFTHPIDVIKHRIMCYQDINTFQEATLDLLKDNKKGFQNLFKGYGSTVTSLVPFIAINFTIFDYLKNDMVNNKIIINPFITLSIGATSALISQTLCYPLDTIRRRMQNKELAYKNGFDAATKIFKYEGYLSFYKGLSANIIRMVPNTAIRFTVFDYLINNFK